MRRVVLVSLAAAACAHSQTGGNPPAAAVPAAPLRLSPTAARKEALDRMARGDWEGARARLDAWLSKEPGKAEALFDAGWVAEKRGIPRDAEDFYRRALLADPRHRGAPVNLARLLRDRDRLAEAEAVLRGALERADGDPGVLNALASVLRAEGKLDDAEAAVRRVLFRHPRDAEAYRNLAAIEADRGRVRLAESALQNARKLDSGDAGIPHALGVLALRRDDPAAARALFDEAVRLDPGLSAAWANLAAIALRYRDYAAAEVAYRKAIELEPGKWEWHLARAWALEGLKKPGEARAEYDHVLARRPHEEDALYGRGLALKAEGDLAGALDAFRAVLALPRAARARDAQSQVAALDLRLKNPSPRPPPTQSPAPGDLSRLPQGNEPGDAPAAALPDGGRR